MTPHVKKLSKNFLDHWRVARQDAGMTNNKVRWANRLQEWREAKGFTVQYAAAALGVSKYRYERWEDGEAEPTATALLLMPEVFGLRKYEALSLEPVE